MSTRLTTQELDAARAKYRAAQHASREGKVSAHNIVANSRGKDLIPFRFNTLGLLASIGRRTGVARILGVNFSGFVAW